MRITSGKALLLSKMTNQNQVKGPKPSQMFKYTTRRSSATMTCTSMHLYGASQTIHSSIALLTVQSEPWHSSPRDPCEHMTVVFAHEEQSKETHITGKQIKGLGVPESYRQCHWAR